MSKTCESQSDELSLPMPSSEAMQHSNQLIELIIPRIKQAGGVIGFDDYMRGVLYEPGYGYYSAGSVKFGAQGDFVTAPEISPLFGACLANQLQQLFDQACAPNLLEFGAGSGKLCEQILSANANIKHYYILDLSADLCARQRHYLEQQLSPELFQKIEWLSGLPTAFDGIVLANEVLDAMPVNIVEKRQQWIELGVGYEGQGFIWKPLSDSSEAVSSIQQIEQQLGEFEQGYNTEINLNYRPWLKSLADSCNQVVILLIDYGYEKMDYYHPSRTSGTVSCYYQHRTHPDPLVLPGLQDVTAFVDFDALADAGEENGFEICGLVSQAEFLLKNALLELAQAKLEMADFAQQIKISQQIKTLSMADEMGERFKVLALQKNIDVEMPAMRRGIHY